ncbi:hypothetical protein [Arachnia propionica]|uniref:hypothetical protein n=1 Tax=Arachnia propionica TaxID=1750 RepID=UPI0016395263|nr:hypothetical protein [Arachnia propionica]
MTVLVHSGHVIEDVLKEQAPNIPPNSDIVMFTIGGNDGGFGTVVKECFAMGFRDAGGCRESVDKFRDFVKDPGPKGLRKRTREVFSAIDQRLKGPDRDLKQMLGSVIGSWKQCWSKAGGCVAADVDDDRSGCDRTGVGSGMVTAAGC